MKWSSPCPICKGEFSVPCTICGWKKQPDPIWTLTTHLSGSDLDKSMNQLIGAKAYQALQSNEEKTYLFKNMKLEIERGKLMTLPFGFVVFKPILSVRVYKIAEPGDPIFVGKRERIDFLNRLLTFKTSNPSADCLEIDAEINKHYEWINGIYLRNRVGGESLHKLSREEYMTQAAMKLLLIRYGAWLRRRNKLGPLMLWVRDVLKYYLAGYREEQVAAKFNIPMSVTVGICRNEKVFSLI